MCTCSPEREREMSFCALNIHIVLGDIARTSSTELNWIYFSELVSNQSRFSKSIILFLSSRRQRERERSVLFNNAFNTFYLQLYGVRHMVKDRSDSEKGNPLSLID